jgi:hypothetical protein
LPISGNAASQTCESRRRLGTTRRRRWRCERDPRG